MSRGLICKGPAYVPLEVPASAKQLLRCFKHLHRPEVKLHAKRSISLWKGSISLKASRNHHIQVPVVSLFEVSTHAVDDNLEDDPALSGMFDVWLASIIFNLHELSNVFSFFFNWETFDIRIWLRHIPHRKKKQVEKQTLSRNGTERDIYI